MLPNGWRWGVGPRTPDFFGGRLKFEVPPDVFPSVRGVRAALGWHSLVMGRLFTGVLNSSLVPSVPRPGPLRPMIPFPLRCESAERQAPCVFVPLFFFVLTGLAVGELELLRSAVNYV